LSKSRKYGIDSLLYGGYDYTAKERNVKDYVNYMLNRSLQMFNYLESMPDSVPYVEAEKQLQTLGYTVFAKAPNGNVYCFPATLGGENDVYERPTQANISSTALNWSATLDIDKDCVVVKNDSLQMGLLPLFNRYCTLLNENDISMLLMDVNKRVQIILSASNDNVADSARQFLADLYAGKQGVIADRELLQALQAIQTTKSTDSIMDLVEYEQYLKASMYNEIGLNSNFNMKRERLTANEVEMNSGNLYPFVDNMLACRIDGYKRVNEMFGTDIHVEYTSSWTMRAKNEPPLLPSEPPQDTPQDEPEKEEQEDEEKTPE